MEETLDNISEKLRSIVDRLGKLSTFFMIPLVFITMWDVFCRKLVWIQIWLVENFGRMFESTLVQEMEWHLHTALFLMVFGYGFTHNRHVRVDFIRENLSFRKKVWIVGVLLKWLPDSHPAPYTTNRDFHKFTRLPAGRTNPFAPSV